MNYAIFRSEPIYTLNDLAQIGSHNKREKKAYKSNPDIDLSKTKDNVELVPLNMKYVKGFYEITKEYKKEHEERMKNEREDRRRTFRQMVDKSKSVVADEMIFTASHNFFNDMPKEKILEWSEYCMAFVKDYLGYEDDQYFKADDYYGYQEDFIYYTKNGSNYEEAEVTASTYNSLKANLYVYKDDIDTYFGQECGVYQNTNNKACVTFKVKYKATQIEP